MKEGGKSRGIALPGGTLRNRKPQLIEMLVLARFTLGLRTHGTCEARLFSLKSEFRLQPESKPR